MAREASRDFHPIWLVRNLEINFEPDIHFAKK